MIYTNLTDGIQYIGYKRAYPTQQKAFGRLKFLGDKAEPNVEWGDDGRIRFETRLPDRVGLFWFEAEVAGCVRRACSHRRVAGGALLGTTGILSLED